MTNTTHSYEEYWPLYFFLGTILIAAAIWGRCWVQVLGGSGALILVVALTAHRYITLQNKDDDKDDTQKNLAISSLAFLVIYIIYAGVFLSVVYRAGAYKYVDLQWLKNAASDLSEYEKECPRNPLTKGLVSLWFLTIALAMAASFSGL